MARALCNSVQFREHYFSSSSLADTRPPTTNNGLSLSPTPARSNPPPDRRQKQIVAAEAFRMRDRLDADVVAMGREPAAEFLGRESPLPGLVFAERLPGEVLVDYKHPASGPHDAA